MESFKREKYLNVLRGQYHNTQIIKAITGVRHCGKSTLLSQIRDELAKEGIPSSSIIMLDTARIDTKKVNTAEAVAALIRMKSAKEGITYLLIDEVQKIKSFIPLLDSLRKEERYSIFVTSSSFSRLEEKALNIVLRPFTFDEYLAFKAFIGKDAGDTESEEELFIKEGGFPEAVLGNGEIKSTIIAELIVEDVRKRKKVRNEDECRSFIDFLSSHTAIPYTAATLHQALNDAGVKITRQAVSQYLAILKDTGILIPLNRYDVRYKRKLSEVSCHLPDPIFISADRKRLCENLLCNYALALGYKVTSIRYWKEEAGFLLTKRGCSDVYANIEAPGILQQIPGRSKKYCFYCTQPPKESEKVIAADLFTFMKEGRSF